ncbi:MAG: hypothetical protein NT149_03710, partial [Candidatus Gottesmanbacteria bacterium]|nr:hypothetical protein [Candidatus Gottesmanbacteria bacterium]
RGIHRELGQIIDTLIGVSPMQEGHGVTLNVGRPTDWEGVSLPIQNFLNVQEDANFVLKADILQGHGARLLTLSIQSQTGIVRSIAIETQAGLGYQSLQVRFHRGGNVPEEVEKAYKELNPPFTGLTGRSKELAITREILTLVYRGGIREYTEKGRTVAI